MRFLETVDVKSNLHIVARERGKIVARHDGHNIWTDLGREFLAQLISFSSFGPDTPERNDRIKYIGFGIGGTRQIAPGVANAAPLSTAYPGTNVNTDTDPTITTLERPVRISGGTTTYPGVGGDTWLGQVQAPAVHTVATEVTFRRLFLTSEISYSSFTTVPLSEAGLFTSAATPTGQPLNTLVAYDTFDSISKTNAVEIEVVWTVRF